MTLRINCWSGPRNISTSFMYAFRQRDDTTVFDEPIYAHYLRATGRDHPRRDHVPAIHDPAAEAAARDLPPGAPPLSTDRPARTDGRSRCRCRPS